MIIALDTETYEYNEKTGTWKPVLNARKFVLGCAKYQGGKPHFFTTKEAMAEWLEAQIINAKKRKKRIFCYAHNMQYDWYAFMHQNILHPNVKYISFSPFIGIMHEKGYFLDTMAFFRYDLKTLGELIALPKLEMPKSLLNIEDMKPYLERDVDIVLQAITGLQEIVENLGFSPRKLMTAGQLAMTSFLTFCKRNGTERVFMRYNVEKHIMEVIPSQYEAYTRVAFRGANTTAFQIGTFENATVYDINHSYSKAMAEMQFPNLSSETFYNNPTEEFLISSMNTHLGVAQVTIIAPTLSHPYLPIYYNNYNHFTDNKKLIGTWTFLELKRALSLGYIIESIKYCVTWKKSDINPLRPFVMHLYNMRQTATGMQLGCIKLLLNNLYGKFAQERTNTDYKFISRADSNQYFDDGYTIVSTFENKYVLAKETTPYKPPYVNPIISTYITAFARDYLWQHLSQIDVKDLLYCDTDSIMVLNKEKYSHVFPLSNKLGEWKLVREGRAKILGEKRYFINDDIHVSGTPRKVTEELVTIEKNGVVEVKKRGIIHIEQEKDIEILKLIGLKDGLASGSFESIGTFTTESKSMRPHNKAMLPLPDVIDETPFYVLPAHLRVYEVY